MFTSQPVDPLFKTLRSRAIGAHRRIRDGLRHGVDQQETTITDTLLLELKRRAPGVIIHTLTQREEAKHGADWEWWFKGGNRWFGMLAQAKRLRPTTHGAFGYNFAYRSGGKGTRQIDRLLDDARARNRAAIYVLYNGPNIEMPGSWRCDLLPRRRDMMGASFLPASVVAHLLDTGASSQGLIRSYDAPLPCLVCPRDSSTCRDVLGWWPGPDRASLARILGFPAKTPGHDLALRAAASCLVATVRLRLGQFRRFEGVEDTELPRGITDDTQLGVTVEPPGYVSQLVEEGGERSTAIDVAELGQNPPRHIVVQLPTRRSTRRGSRG